MGRYRRILAAGFTECQQLIRTFQSPLGAQLTRDRRSDRKEPQRRKPWRSHGHVLLAAPQAHPGPAAARQCSEGGMGLMGPRSSVALTRTCRDVGSADLVQADLDARQTLPAATLAARRRPRRSKRLHGGANGTKRFVGILQRRSKPGHAGVHQCRHPDGSPRSGVGACRKQRTTATPRPTQTRPMRPQLISHCRGDAASPKKKGRR